MEDYKSMYYYLAGRTSATVDVLDATIKVMEGKNKSIEGLYKSLKNAHGNVVNGLKSVIFTNGFL